MKTHRSRPKGLVVVPAMVCLVVVSLIAGVMLRQASFQRKMVRDEERRAQCDWLVESGIDRAAARLRVEPDYQGEAWGPRFGDIKAEVQITIENAKDNPERRVVKVAATMPLPDDGRVRAAIETTLTLTPTSPKGPR